MKKESTQKAPRPLLSTIGEIPRQIEKSLTRLAQVGVGYLRQIEEFNSTLFCAFLSPSYPPLCVMSKIKSTSSSSPLFKQDDYTSKGTGFLVLGTIASQAFHTLTSKTDIHRYSGTQSLSRLRNEPYATAQTAVH